ncbi:MAG: hypothetical protein L0Y56_10620, partial [Nitrospira sp.]|nr:hypothetical protein [Nitrospira sp.]
MISTFSHWVIRWRWGIILATLLVVFSAASGARFINFMDDYRIFFGKENPELLDFEALQNTYTKTDNLFFVVAPKDGKVFTRQTLASVVWLTREAWQIPYSTRVDSITNFQHTSAQGTPSAIPAAS